MSKPVAVLISDIHYNINTLHLADTAMRQAVAQANSLDVPLVVAGDLHDTKALLRGECVSAMITTFKVCVHRPIVLVGNHDLLNEKSSGNSLEFLEPYVDLIEHPQRVDAIGSWLIPYHSDPEPLLGVLETIPKGSRLIMHQGVTGALAGDYIHDKSALPKETFADFRVISGHYHNRHDIKCGRPRKGAVGLFSYIGNPYSLTFGEAKDGDKGFQVLNDDGSLQFVPTNLRKHVIMEGDADLTRFPLSSSAREVTKDDLVWLKIKDTPSRLAKVDKKAWGMKLLGHTNYKLDLIPVESEAVLTSAEVVPPQTDGEILDTLIDRMPETPEQRRALKALWREVLNES